MSRIRHIINENRWFFYPFIVISFITVVSLFAFGHAGSHLFINKLHSSGFDLLFKYVTLLGGGMGFVICLFVLLFIKYRYALVLVVSYVVSGLIAQGLKHTFRWYRPVKYFYFDDVKLHKAEGVVLKSLKSFPSGHATDIFCVMCCLALVSKNKKLGFIFFLIALMAGFSRVYLNQHFTRDVVVGALLGCIVSLISYLLINKHEHQLEGNIQTNIFGNPKKR